MERDQWGTFGCSPEEQRVKDVRQQILDYGVHEKYVFRVEDVTLKRNTPKVVRCLEEVAKLVNIISAVPKVFPDSFACLLSCFIAGLGRGF